MTRHDRSLELDKILERLAAQTSCEDAANAARASRILLTHAKRDFFSGISLSLSSQIRI